MTFMGHFEAVLKLFTLKPTHRGYPLILGLLDSLESLIWHG
jgi:hypothetical protein